MKYELNRSYNGGGVVYVLKARHLIHPYSRGNKRYPRRAGGSLGSVFSYFCSAHCLGEESGFSW